MTKPSRLLVLLVALLVAVQIVRNAVVQALSDRSPLAAARVWPGHPSAELAVAMSSFRRAAREGKPAGASIFALVNNAAIKAPLAPEPFLVRGVELQLAGNIPVATEAFLAAEKRDPSSLPVRYFLADLFYRTGDSRRAIRELGAITTLAPQGMETVAPYIAVYARDRSTWPDLQAMFRSNPQLEDAFLTVLAADPDNADAVLALAGAELPMSKSHWAPMLVNTLVNSGQYSQAHSLWARTWHVPANVGAELYDGSFTNPNGAPPFNWELNSSNFGMAERQRGGRLHVLYFGHGKGVLARQLLLLAPGTYRMTLSVSGDLTKSHSLTWSLRCDKSLRPLASIPLDNAARQGWTFVVDRGCPAQWIEMSARDSDVARQFGLTLSNLRLVQEGSRA